jgi:uncharacterized OB-fold protein
MTTSDPLHWPLVTEYFERAEADELTVPVCEDCEATHFPPRAVCPYCLSGSLSLRESAGEGTVYSFSVVHVDYHPTWGTETPYVNALVDLDDGPVVFGNVIDCDPEEVSVGAPVEVAFEEIEGTVRPVFALA